MKHSLPILAFGVLAALAPLQGAELQARWNDLCRLAGPRQLTITTSDGKTISGTCNATSLDELSLSSNQLVLKIARSTLSRIQMYQPGNHRLADLGDGMSKSFRRGFGWLFSPAAALGLVAIPATVAWGAVSAPFCLLGDLASDGPVTQEIKVID